MVTHAFDKFPGVVMAQQWPKDKFVIIGFAAGLAVLAGLALGYWSRPAAEDSDDKGDPFPPPERDTPPAEEAQNEEPAAKVGPPSPAPARQRDKNHRRR